VPSEIDLCLCIFAVAAIYHIRLKGRQRPVDLLNLGRLFTFIVYLAEFLGNEPLVPINYEVNLPWPRNRSLPSLDHAELGARQKAAF
jgi:hypothetical protein